ncbi:hypothetical protein E4U57_002541 [Claviceps arundinis]|uniref:Uncharacterized protein n=1 Tax=Claviceps arundinis TaxID=1623583 RepID=A0ABQ7PAI1_9HYPO|nr:hypothetical protein E4U57_002541 [Claviceps arundinis]
MDTKANCSDEALPDEDSSDEDLSAEENPANLLTRTPPTPAEGFDSGNLPEESASYCVLYFVNEDFDTEQNQPEESLSERPVNDPEDSSDEDLTATEDPTCFGERPSIGCR